MHFNWSILRRISLRLENFVTSYHKKRRFKYIIFLYDERPISKQYLKCKFTNRRNKIIILINFWKNF